MIKKYIYLAIAAVGLAAIVGAYFKGRADVRATWELEKVESAKLALEEKSRIEAQYRARENLQAEATRNLEAKHAEEIKAIAAGRDDFERRLRERLRASASRADSCGLPAATADPGEPALAPGSRDVEFRGIDIEGVQRVRAVGLELQALVRECHAWAAQNGR